MLKIIVIEDGVPVRTGVVSEADRSVLNSILVPLLPDRKKDGSKYVQESMAYIDSHYSDSAICIKTIAGFLEISEGHLSHIFKKETGSTVMTYITGCRMGAAMKLLCNCRYKVYEVADMVGYKDITYFSAIFKKWAGMTPSEYQERSA